MYKVIDFGYMHGNTSATIQDIDFFYTRTIESLNGVQWPKGVDYNKKQLSKDFRARLEENESIAFTVIQDDSIRYEEYWGVGSKKSRTNSFSAGKSIVSILIGIAVEEGAIDSIHQKVIDFIPEYKNKKYPYNSEVTIEHLLSMNSGMDWDEGYVNPLGITAEAYFTERLKDLMFEINFTEKPGTKWNYQSGNTQVLGILLERATGVSLSEYASEKLWKPLQATDDAEWMLDQENGTEKAYCCFNSNALDFARFGHLYLNNGKWKGQQIVDSSYVAASLKSGLNEQYGYSWWLYNTEYKYPVFCMIGINGQYVINIPELNLVAVRLGHKEEGKYNDQHKDLIYYIEKIIEQYDV
ncbi:MAG: serine hydrolase [Flavobacteriales bacterium]|nr:serine hydrolase [Flavobacteriales bacterium]